MSGFPNAHLLSWRVPGCEIAASSTVTLNLYEGLGHALSMTENPAEDAFAVMDDAPIADIIDWLRVQA